MTTEHRNGSAGHPRPVFWKSEFDRIFVHAAAAMPGDGGKRHRNAVPGAIGAPAGPSP
jgi:hypothetical protein